MARDSFESSRVTLDQETKRSYCGGLGRRISQRDFRSTFLTPVRLALLPRRTSRVASPSSHLSFSRVYRSSSSSCLSLHLLILSSTKPQQLQQGKSSLDSTALNIKRTTPFHYILGGRFVQETKDSGLACLAFNAKRSDIIFLLLVDFVLPLAT
jgi:hypothetical protein